MYRKAYRVYGQARAMRGNGEYATGFHFDGDGVTLFWCLCEDKRAPRKRSSTVYSMCSIELGEITASHFKFLVFSCCIS